MGFAATACSHKTRQNGSTGLAPDNALHSNVETTLDIYAKGMIPAKLDAQGWVLQQLLTGDVESAVS